MGTTRLEAFSDGVLRTNLHLLFRLSLVPFATAWMGENRFPLTPVALHGATLLGLDWKGNLSPGLYLLAIPGAYLSTRIAGAVYAGVALMWPVPDRRIERVLSRRPRSAP